MKEFLEKIKNAVISAIKRILLIIKAIVLGILRPIKNLILGILLNRITIAVVSIVSGFVIGARMHEIGYLDGKFGKSIHGATVFLSGPCKVQSVNRLSALAEDEVKVTGYDKEKIIGVIRKTREIVECDAKNIAVDKLPLLANIMKSPVEIPEIKAQQLEEKRDPEWKRLAQRTLLMTGKCKDDAGKDLPAFSDEVVDVTNVEESKENPDAFVMMGIRKSDKITVSCDSRYVKYSSYMEKLASVDKKSEPIEAEERKEKNYLGETILVTGTCFPDTRLPKHKQKQRVAFYPLVNARVQVTEQSLDKDSGKLVRFSGAALDAGVMLVCDSSRAPITYKEYDSESMRLSPINKSSGGSEENLPAQKEQDREGEKVKEDVASGLGKPGVE